MAKLPQISGKQLIKILTRRYGMQVVRIRGSHHFLDGKGKRTTVPVHSNRPLKTGTLRSILRDVDIAPQELHDHL